VFRGSGRRIVETLGTEDDPVIRNDLLDIVELLARDHPADIVDAADTLVSLLEEPMADDRKAQLLGILAIVAESEEAAVAEAIEPVIPTVIGSLGADDPALRAAAVNLLMYIWNYHTAAVESAIPELMTLLDDEHESTRGSAVWVLGRIGGEDELSRLETICDSDPSPEVRTTALQAIERILHE